MSPDKIRIGMKVKIVSGDRSHPLHGHQGEVISIIPPLPPDSELPVSYKNLRALYKKMHEESEVQFFRPEWFDEPFAWPKGRVEIYLGNLEDGRKWPFSYVTVAPHDIEPA